MPDRPIAFSAPMVRALLLGRKTQTRRVLTRLDRFGRISEFGRSDTPGYLWHFRDKAWRGHDLRHFELLDRLPFAPDDRLWVKERVEQWCTGPLGYVRYAADRKATFQAWPPHWSRDFAPPMFMPRAFSRLTLIVDSVGIERVQDIRWDDAVAEGLFRLKASGRFVATVGDQYFGGASLDPCITYSWLWDRLNGERAGGRFAWAQNPYVVVITFTVHHKNIDALGEAA